MLRKKFEGTPLRARFGQNLHVIIIHVDSSCIS
jgi:hypothetical protein